MPGGLDSGTCVTLLASAMPCCFMISRSPLFLLLSHSTQSQQKKGKRRAENFGSWLRLLVGAKRNFPVNDKQLSVRQPDSVEATIIETASSLFAKLHQDGLSGRQDSGEIWLLRQGKGVNNLEAYLLYWFYFCLGCFDLWKR